MVSFEPQCFDHTLIYSNSLDLFLQISASAVCVCVCVNRVGVSEGVDVVDRVIPLLLVPGSALCRETQGSNKEVSYGVGHIFEFSD